MLEVLFVKPNAPADIFTVMFRYKLPNHTTRWYNKAMKMNNKRIKGIPYSFIECFIRFIIQKSVITPELLEYSLLTYLKAFICGEIYTCYRYYNDGVKSQATIIHFVEFVTRYQAGDLFEEGVHIINGPPPPEGCVYGEGIPKEDCSIFPKEGFFHPDPTTGKSYLILGSSFSGKTTFMVEQLNKLFKEEYALVCLFTETKNSEPLKKLKESLPILIFEGWKPEIPQFLKGINDRCENKFKFLIILDDVVDQKTSKTLNKLVLTYRNANISTCISIQYPKLISASSRSSFHEIVITGSRSLEWWKACSEVIDLKGWFKEVMLSHNNPLNKEVSTKPTADEIYKGLKRVTKNPGTYIYINAREGKEPCLQEK
jgi:hypothetical protein